MLELTRSKLFAKTKLVASKQRVKGGSERLVRPRSERSLLFDTNFLLLPICHNNLIMLSPSLLSQACPGKSMVSCTDRLDMTIAVD